MTDTKDIDIGEKISILSELSESLILVSPQKFLQTLPLKICSLLNVSVCIIWQANQEQQVFQVLETAGDIDGEYKRINLDFQHQGVRHLFKKNKILSLADVNQSSHRFGDLDEINKRELISFMSVPLKFQEEMLGIVDVFSKKTHDFKEWEKNLFQTSSNYANLAFQKLKASKEKEYIYCDRKKLHELTQIIHDMTAASESQKVWKLLRIGVEKLVASKYIWIGK